MSQSKYKLCGSEPGTTALTMSGGVDIFNDGGVV
jgi:hypothetical protein